MTASVPSWLTEGPSHELHPHGDSFCRFSARIEDFHEVNEMIQWLTGYEEENGYGTQPLV